ncbi:Acyltransferase-domain-containing protein [Desulfonema limicola]|uniref:Acyltransferase-domain-containing protein n=1 Tax=Desulfonema limicola TaxID=45656 RepID=A0A975GEC7_9BACT|nr:GNAT family N-acetyltransferase [Desulfonema limicola]QTA78101.1 Acyltransferase-domain-containing protein [Desulfonema limicola]
MFSSRIAEDIEDCREIWNSVIIPERFSDLWEVRECFHRYYNHQPRFIFIENTYGGKTLIPLSLVDEHNCYAYFPGETWQGQTWLEQNKIYISNGFSMDDLISSLDRPCHLRYISEFENFHSINTSIDEVGYLFVPSRYEYDMQNYFQEFSRKSYKQINREIEGIKAKGVSFRYDDLSDFDIMISMNIKRFGTYSYFYDPRFRESFKSLAFFLRERGLLKIVTVLVKGEPAAVDMACLFKNVLTILAGGTDSRFPGIAKLINMHHIEKACMDRVQEVDFLCGDFTWKKLFHLMPRPLYQYSNRPNAVMDTGAITFSYSRPVSGAVHA